MSEPLGPPPSYPPPAFPPPAFPPPAFPPPSPPRPRRWPVVALAFSLAAVVVAAAVVAPRLVDNEDAGGRTKSADPSSAVEVNLDEVKVYDVKPAHDNGDLTFPQSPTVGGLHNDIWLDCGVYDEPVPEEYISHDLEHGTVWITYESGLDADDVAELAEALPQNGILSPYDDLRAPVVVTVWGRQLDLTGADDPRLGLFIDAFSEGVTAPEPFGSCAGGATLEQLEQRGSTLV